MDLRDGGFLAIGAAEQAIAFSSYSPSHVLASGDAQEKPISIQASPFPERNSAAERACNRRGPPSSGPGLYLLEDHDAGRSCSAVFSRVCLGSTAGTEARTVQDCTCGVAAAEHFVGWAL